MRNQNIIVLAALALASGLAAAQTVYRCGNSYSQQPCPGGAAISPSDTRTPAQAQGATRAANTDARLAAELERARLAQEKNAPKAIVIGPQTPAKDEAGKPGQKAKSGKLEQFTAVSPRKAGEAKKKQRKKAA